MKRMDLWKQLTNYKERISVIAALFALTGHHNQLGASLTVRLPINEPRYYALRRWCDNLDKLGSIRADTFYGYRYHLPVKF